MKIISANFNIPAPAEMKVGDRGVLPTAAMVVSRFPKL
jgi:hypothetical protein